MSGRWLDRGRRWGGPPACAVAVGLVAPVPAAAQSELPFDSMEPTVRRQFVEAVRGVEAAPLDARAHGHLGMLYHAYELHASAEPYYRRAVDLAPGGIRWRYYLGVVLVAIGDPDAAVAQFDAVLAEAPGDIAALLGRAEADRTRNRLDDALAGYRRVITLAPRTPQAYGGAGHVLGRQGDLEAAVARYEAAIKFAADHPYGPARYGLGQALRKLGRIDEAIEQLELAEQQRGREPPVDDPLMREVEALATGAIEALHRGIDLLAAGRLEEAVVRLNESIRINSDLAEAHSQLGAARLEQGDLPAAETSLRHALRLHPGYVDALQNLGVLEHRRGALAEAVEHFQAVLAVRPDHFDAQLGLGTDLRPLGRRAEAAVHLRAALRLRPDDARPYKRLAAVLAEQGEFEEAIAQLRWGVERLPDDLSVADRLAWMLATCPHEHLRDGAEALRVAEDVCRRTNRRVPRGLDTLAAALASLGRYDEAVAVAEEARGLARARGDETLAVQIETRLSLYRDGRGYLSAP